MNDILEEFSKELALRIDARGFSESAALADIAATTLQDLYGGERPSIPKISRVQRLIRDADIRRLFNGTNMTEVCSQHDCSPSTVYRVVKYRRKVRGRRG